MKEFISKLKQNKRVGIGLGIVFILIIALCLVLFTDLGRLVRNGPRIIESDIEIVKEIEKVTDEEDIVVRDELISKIERGISGCYNINGRHFVILTTGTGKSVTDFEYNTEVGLDGSLNLKYRLSDTIDGENKIRYKIIEVSGTVNVSEWFIESENELRNGITNVMVYENGSNKKIYYTMQNKTEENNSGYVPGIYAFFFKDNEVTKHEKVDSIDIVGCTIINNITDKIYNVQLPNGDIINASINKLNIEENSTCNIRFSYSNGFRGKILKEVQ